MINRSSSSSVLSLVLPNQKPTDRTWTLTPSTMRPRASSTTVMSFLKCRHKPFWHCWGRWCNGRTAEYPHDGNRNLHMKTPSCPMANSAFWENICWTFPSQILLHVWIKPQLARSHWLHMNGKSGIINCLVEKTDWTRFKVWDYLPQWLSSIRYMALPYF